MEPKNRAYAFNGRISKHLKEKLGILMMKKIKIEKIILHPKSFERRNLADFLNEKLNCN